MTELEKLFDECPWSRKFEHQFPDGRYMYVWHGDCEEEIEHAEKTLPDLEEETQEYCRALYLCSVSRGQTLIVTEETWD